MGQGMLVGGSEVCLNSVYYVQYVGTVVSSSASVEASPLSAPLRPLSLSCPPQIPHHAHAHPGRSCDLFISFHEETR